MDLVLVAASEARRDPLLGVLVVALVDLVLVVASEARRDPLLEVLVVALVDLVLVAGSAAKEPHLSGGARVDLALEVA